MRRRLRRWRRPSSRTSGKRPKPANWGGMTKAQRENCRLETARREATSTFRSRWDLKIAWGPAKLLQWATIVEGVEYGAETEDSAGSLDKAAAAGMRPPRPVDWAAAGAAGAAEDWQMDVAGAEAAMTAAGGAAEDGPAASDHAWASGGVSLRRSRVRRGHGERGGGSGGDGSGGGGSAAAKTSELGHDDERLN